MRAVWALLGFGMFALAATIHSSLQIFFDAPSFLIVIVPSFLISFAFHGPGSVFRALRSNERDEQALKDSIVILRTLQNLTRACGCIGSLMGLVMMLANMDDPAKIGPAMAVAVLSVFYGLFIAELFLGPLITQRQVGLPAEASTKSSANPQSTLVTFALPMILFCFCVMWLSIGMSP